LRWTDHLGRLYVNGYLELASAVAATTTRIQPASSGFTAVYTLPTAQPDTEGEILACGTDGQMFWTDAAGGGGGSGGSIAMSEDTVALTGASVTASALIPADSMITGVIVSFSGMTGPTSIDIGESSRNTQEWGKGIATAGLTLTKIGHFQEKHPRYTDIAVDVVITAIGGNFSAGAATIKGFYWQPAA